MSVTARIKYLREKLSTNARKPWRGGGGAREGAGSDGGMKGTGGQKAIY